ncbi:MAG: tRNA (adenosine(37)-N6)-threonylcarbamoyltransferase complex dimerization subunit type 1 TsaB, partial [Sphaerochaetaceae bacterium]|nr:tRNA (adenosine(37)-N6)-threonylcarbamoyltransferase complex dimerization subunit type 1 TsaB [Sphaerochaetaceae bacterium]
MIILAVDTSSFALHVALKTPSYYEIRVCEGKTLQHSEKLMVTIEELCKNAGIKTKDIELFLCTRGPGSFTGLRIGMSALKGMALGTNGNLVSISTMRAYGNTVPYFDGAIVTVIDGKKQRWYLSAFEKEGKEGSTLRPLMTDTDGTEEDLVKVLEPYNKVLVVGPDAKVFTEILKNHKILGKKTILCSTVCNYSLMEALIEEGL